MKEKILIVDDDSSILLAFDEMLTEYGYAVDTAEDEVGALEKISIKQFDIAIVDMMLKETKGLDLIGKLQNKFQNIVAIALTGYPPQEYVAKSFCQGAIEFLTKSCDREDLVAAICRGLAQREARKENKNARSSFPWEQIIRENPSCVDTILKYSKRKIDAETFMKTKRCCRNFECLLSEDMNCCLLERNIGEGTSFISKENKRGCESSNMLSFGSSFICNCPIRGELYRKHKI